MTAIATPSQRDHCNKYPARVGDREFVVTVQTYPQDGSYNAGQTWVKIQELVYTEKTVTTRLLHNSHIPHYTDDLAALREAFNEIRTRLKTTARFWAQYRFWASLEKGGKRGYYTRHANEYFADIPEAAAEWKLAKAIWKEITKL